jgi:outer membrane protein assembly factor BamB
MKRTLATTVLLACVMLCAPVFGATAKDRAAEIVKLSGVRAGLVVHVGVTDGALTAELSQGGKFLVHGLSADAASVMKARKHIHSLGLYGQVSVEAATLKALPYADNLVNLIVAESDVPSAEAMRVLCPGGALLVKKGGKWTATVKPRPKAMDDWPMFDHGPDGNPVSQDQLVGPAASLRWRAAMWSTHTVDTFRSWLVARGRMFFCLRRPTLDGHRIRYILTARDAFNGLLLWERPVTWAIGSKYGDRNVVATADRLYLPLQPKGPVVALDAATGRTVQTYAGTGRPSMMVLHDGKLIMSTWRSSLAVDVKTGKRAWSHKTAGGQFVLADGQLLFGNVYPRKIVSVDPKTGKTNWQADGGGCERFTGPKFYRGTLILTQPGAAGGKKRGLCLRGFSPKDGSRLWSFEPKSIWRKGGCYMTEVFGARGLMWAHVDVDADPAAKNAGKRPSAWVGLDPATGEVRKRHADRTSDASFSKMLANGIHRCNRGRATERFYPSGSYEFFEWSTGKYKTFSFTRSSCGTGSGMLPANGLVYTPPVACVCRHWMQRGGFHALAHRPGGVKPAAGPRREKGPAYAKASAGRPAHDQTRNAKPETRSSTDWPTYRHDAQRLGATNTAVPHELAPRWSTQVGPGLTAPTAAGGIVCVAATDGHRVVALDASTGKPRWDFTAGGRIDTPPTLHAGLALLGSRDGWVYCLRASDGALVWRYRAAPGDEYVLVEGQLESAWPVHGSVLMFDNTVFVAAGRHTGLDGGVTLTALRPADGAVVWARHIEKLPGLRGDRPVALLTHVGGAVGMGAWTFDAKTGKTVKRPRGRSMTFGASGFLDSDWRVFSNTKNRLRWSDGRASGELLTSGEKWTCGVSALAPRGYRSHGPKLGMGDYALFGKTGARDAGWTVRMPLQMYAMVMAGDTLFVAGTPDVVIPGLRETKDRKERAKLIASLPEETFNPKGGELWAFSAADGKELSTLKLDAAPVFDGMAAAGGKLYLSTRDGRLRCFGAKEEKR